MRNNQLKYRGNTSANFSDEIIFGDNLIISKNKINHSNIDLFAKTTQKRTSFPESSLSHLISFLIVSFSLIAFVVFFSKIVSITFFSFNSLSTSIFVGGYFLLFTSTVVFLLKKKTLSLEIKDETLHIKSFPVLNKKIPVNQVLKCELNTLSKNKYDVRNKMQFALNENGNRYKQKLTSGVTLQLITGQHIIIASLKS